MDIEAARCIKKSPLRYSSKRVQFLEPDPTPTPAPTAAPTATPNPVPKTGDSANPILWLSLILLGLAGIGGLAARKVRK